MSKTLPAGTFLIQGKVSAHDGGAVSIFCALSPDNLVTDWDTGGNSTTSGGQEITVPVQTVQTLAAQTTVTFYCGASTTTAHADWAKLTAIPVGTVH